MLWLVSIFHASIDFSWPSEGQRQGSCEDEVRVDQEGRYRAWGIGDIWYGDRVKGKDIGRMGIWLGLGVQG
jgi:hypothetical protein